MVSKPFQVSGLVKPPFFIDREKELNRIAHGVGSMAENILLLGMRRIGKSSLILNAQATICRRNPKALLVWVDCRRVLDGRRFTRELATAVLEAYAAKGRLKAWLALKSRIWKDAIVDLAPEVHKIGGSVTDILTVFLEFREKEIRDADAMETGFVFLQRFTEEKDIDLVIVMDEFQELSENGLDHSYQLFKSFGDRLPRVRFIFTGSVTRVLERVVGARGAALFGMASKIRLEGLPTEAVNKFVRQRLEAHDIKITDAALMQISDLTGGVSYYVQRLGLQIWLNHLGKKRPVTASQVDKAFDEMVAEEDPDLYKWYKRLRSWDQHLLRFLAVHGPATRTRMAESLGQQSGAISTYVRDLEGDMEIVAVGKGRFKVANPVTAYWLRTRLS